MQSIEVFLTIVKLLSGNGTYSEHTKYVRFTVSVLVLP